MLRRIAWGFAGLVAVVLLGLPLWIQTHRADLPNPQDGDLVEPVALEPGPNGFDDLVAAAAAASELEDEEVRTRLHSIRKREVWDSAFVEERARRHASALAVLERAVDAPKGTFPFGPGTSGAFDQIMDTTIRVQLLVALAACEAELLERQGHVERAIERAQLGLRLGHRISEFRNANLLTMLTAVSFQAISVGELEALTRRSSLTPASARELAARIGALRIRPEVWERMWATEYHWSKRTILDAFHEGQGVLLQDELYERWVRSVDSPLWLEWIPPDYLFQPNRTFARYAESYRHQQDKSSMSCRDAHSPERAPEPLGRLRMLVMPNPSGSILHAIATPNYDRFQFRRCHGDARLALLQAAIAVRAYAQAHGALPERLEALVPEYLESVPIDPFDGAPIRYAKERGVVSSVGDDFVESPDAAATDLKEMAEPAIRVAL